MLAMVYIVGDCKHYKLLLLNLARSYSLDLMRVDVFVVLFPKSFRQTRQDGSALQNKLPLR